MSTAIRSAFTAAVGLAGAGAIACSAVAGVPSPSVPVRSAVELTAASAPAVGAIPFQILINQLENIVALAPIVIGSTEQCAVCLGPSGPDPVPFTGYGAIGIVAGVLSAPVVLINTIISTGDFWRARGLAGLAIQTPITNTFLDLIAPRSVGGFNLEGTFTRAFTALNDAVTGILAIAAQALVTGPVTVIGGAVSAAQLFTATLADTGDFIGAFSLGAQVLRAAATSAVTDLTTVVRTSRTQVYGDLTAGAPALAATRAHTSARATIRTAAKVAKPATEVKRSAHR